MSDKTELLTKFDNSKLIDIVKNYRQYGYDDNLRNTAINILKGRGIQEEDLKLTGNFENQTFDSAKEIAISYSRNSKLTLLFYIMNFTMQFLMPLIGINSESGAWSFLIVTILCFILYFIFLIRSLMDHSKFYKAIGKEMGTGDYIIYLVAGMPLYIFMYFHYRGQMKEEMKLIK